LLPALVVGEHFGEELRQVLQAVESRAAARLHLSDSAEGRLAAEIAGRELDQEGPGGRQSVGAFVARALSASSGLHHASRFL
jgi:hypothetical protein